MRYLEKEKKKQKTYSRRYNEINRRYMKWKKNIRRKLNAFSSKTIFNGKNTSECVSHMKLFLFKDAHAAFSSRS